MSARVVRTYIWSKKIRLFHWLNVLAIIVLLAIGLVIWNAGALGVTTEGKILLKTAHVLVGYVFAANLLFRITIGFIGKNYERWAKTLPFTRGYGEEIAQFRHTAGKVFKGHNPAGKLMVAALLTAMTVQMVSGLVLAGTDIYYPPFGHYVAKAIAVDPTDLAAIQPYSKTNVDEQAYNAMRALRSPFMTAHKFAFYTLLFLIPLHIVGVIWGERKEKSSLVSAMIHGYKYLPDEPAK